MRKTIPEEVHIYCDRCGARCNDSNFKRQSHISVNRGELDHMWEYHNHSKVYELCDSCSDDVVDFIRGDN
jgi:hypothetical protein